MTPIIAVVALVLTGFVAGVSYSNIKSLERIKNVGLTVRTRIWNTAPISDRESAKLDGMIELMEQIESEFASGI